MNENNETLQDMRTRLLAASLHPDKANKVRGTFIEAVKKLEPSDIPVLLSNNLGIPNLDVINLAALLKISTDELLIIQDNLISIGLVTATINSPVALTSFGREFLKAITFPNSPLRATENKPE